MASAGNASNGKRINMIKAIETIYKGYRFRSRLEARWAVFFDVLGVQWEYEKEGYDLGKFGWYLPDFWLPTQQYWCEIKPNHLYARGTYHFDSIEDQIIYNKCGALHEMTGHKVCLLTGELKPFETYYNEKNLGEMPPYLVFSGYDIDPPGNYFADYCQQWFECPSCGAIDISYQGKTEKCYCGCNSYSRGDSSKIKFAYETARQSRFEHGENGKQHA